MARSFDGTRLMYPSASATANLNGFTVACWAKYSALRTGLRSNGLIDLTWGTANVTGTDWLYLSLNSDKTLNLRWGFTTNDTPDVAVSTSAASINAGEWHHFAVTASSRTSPTIKFYVDGTQLGSNVSGTNMVGFSAASFLYVGGHARDYIANTFSQQSYWQGSIAELGIWTTVQSAGTLSTLAAGRAPSLFPTDLYAASALVGYGSTEPVTNQTYVLNANGTASDSNGPGLDYGVAAFQPFGEIPRPALQVAAY